MPTPESMCRTGPTDASSNCSDDSSASVDLNSNSNCNSCSQPAAKGHRRYLMIPKRAISPLHRRGLSLPFMPRFCTNRLLSLLLSALLLAAIWRVWLWGKQYEQRTTVIVVTPTHKRPECSRT